MVPQETPSFFLIRITIAQAIHRFRTKKKTASPECGCFPPPREIAFRVERRRNVAPPVERQKRKRMFFGSAREKEQGGGQQHPSGSEQLEHLTPLPGRSRRRTSSFTSTFPTSPAPSHLVVSFSATFFSLVLPPSLPSRERAIGTGTRARARTQSQAQAQAQVQGRGR